MSKILWVVEGRVPPLHWRPDTACVFFTCVEAKSEMEAQERQQPNAEFRVQAYVARDVLKRAEEAMDALAAEAHRIPAARERGCTNVS